MIRLGNTMEIAGIEQDTYILNLLINAFCHCSQLRFALSTLARMLKAGHEPDVFTFTTLLRPFCLEENASVYDAPTLFKNMKAMGYKPNVVTYNTVIKGLLNGNMISQVPGVLDQMFERGCQPNAVTKSTFISGLCKQDLHGSAILLLRKMENDNEDVTTKKKILIHIT